MIHAIFEGEWKKNVANLSIQLLFWQQKFIKNIQRTVFILQKWPACLNN